MVQKSVSFREPLVGVQIIRADDRPANSPAQTVAVPNQSTHSGSAESPTESEEARANRELQRAEIEQVLGTINEAVLDLEERRRASLGELQEIAIELAVSVASKVIHETVVADAFPIEKTIAELIDRCKPQLPVSVRLHPQDMAVLDLRTEGQPPPWAGLSALQFLPDTSLKRGDCQVDSQDYSYLSQIDAQLSDIRQHLLEDIDDAQTERRQTAENNRGLQRYPDRRETA